MKYKEIEVVSINGTDKHIVINREDGSAYSFPADESNPEYVAFLEQLEAE